MADRVKPPTRRYESPLRKEQAAATARQILAAAQRLFEAQGYPTTSMAAVAAEAGVALKTVYLTFETKAGLLREVWNTTLRGFADIPVADQPWYREVVEEPDPAKMLDLNARNSTVVKRRIGQLTRVIRDGAAADADVAALWTHIQTDFHANQGVLVKRLAAAKALRPGLTVARGTDVLWALVHPDVWHLLVDQRGWDPADYQRWLAETSRTQLLRA
jgi:AcrR family transcriptional regulator